jgi:carbon monoxide dehydrogenase subunit G
MIKAVVNVEAPRHQVFSVLTDYPRYQEWLPACQQSNVVSGSGSTAETEIVISSIKTMTLVLRFEAEPIQLLSFRLVRSKDIKGYTGSYRLMDAADGKGTVVIAEMELDAGAMVPKFMVDRMAKKSIDDTGRALKKYIQRLPPAAAPVPEVPRVAAVVRPRRAKRILQVVRTSAGHQIWYMGETVLVKS